MRVKPVMKRKSVCTRRNNEANYTVHSISSFNYSGHEQVVWRALSPSPTVDYNYVTRKRDIGHELSQPDKRGWRLDALHVQRKRVAKRVSAEPYDGSDYRHANRCRRDYGGIQREGLQYADSKHESADLDCCDARREFAIDYDNVSHWRHGGNRL